MKHEKKISEKEIEPNPEIETTEPDLGEDSTKPKPRP